MAVFSSTGLAVGGRIKPDVTAPGFFITSANSNADGDCPITEMAGTSMATPITAGNVALIRQYLREGFYPTGKRGNNLGGNNFDGGMIPSGALMKAMTISAGQVMPGVFPQPGPGAQGAPLSGYPNQYSGYGRTQLNTVLYAEDDGKSAGDRLFIIDGETVATGEEKVYTIPTRGDDEGWGTEFKAVLVWTDPPAEPISQNPLVNNLDLEVDGQNGNSDGTGAAPDTVNNVEAVRLTATAGGTIEVKVKGTSVVEGGSQKFALVVTGPLSLTSPPPAPPPAASDLGGTPDIDEGPATAISRCKSDGQRQRLQTYSRCKTDSGGGNDDSLVMYLYILTGVLGLFGPTLIVLLVVRRRKHRTQPPQSSASNAAPQQVEVMVT